MECKDGGNEGGTDKKEVLIETLWNVKAGMHRLHQSPCCVLIETLWNVKELASAVEASGFKVLIETLWNVK